MAEIHLTAEELFKLHDSLCFKAKATMVEKNHDYSTGHSEGDVFANFRNSPAYADVEPEQGILLRIGDKIARVKTWLKAGTLLVKDEGLDNVFQDMINYTILLAGMIEEKKKNQASTSSVEATKDLVIGQRVVSKLDTGSIVLDQVYTVAGFSGGNGTPQVVSLREVGGTYHRNYFQ